MSNREREFLSKLADLVEQYEAQIYYTIDDDGIHIEIDGNDCFHGFGPDPKELRTAAA